MKHCKLEYKQFIKQPIDRVFHFFSMPENLEYITPPRLLFRILTPLPIIIKKGSIIDYKIKILGIPVKWKTLITEYIPPHKFIDEQIKGPYSLWKHTHTFIEEEEGTTIHDKIHYIVPFGMFGRIINLLWITKDLDSIFTYRRNKIDQYFNTGNY